MMIKIWHNPRCSKSREGLAILKGKNIDFETFQYLKEDLTFQQLEDVIEKLGISAIDLVRKNEAVWKEQFKGKELSEKEIIQAMVDHPRLIERPIVEKDNRAVIGRPSENIENLLSHT